MCCTKHTTEAAFRNGGLGCTHHGNTMGLGLCGYYCWYGCGIDDTLLRRWRSRPSVNPRVLRMSTWSCALERMIPMVQHARSTSVEPPAIFHRLVAPTAGFVCFCRAPAQHIRYTSGLTWAYCNRHQQSSASVRVQTVTVFPSDPE